MKTVSVTNLIKKEFINRCQKNERYSVRAYARNLKVDHSLLAKIMRGQKPLTKKMAYHIGYGLGISASEIKGLISTTENSFSSNIQDDVFVMLSDWYHFAFLEFIKTEGFSYSPKDIARTFALNVFEVEQAFNRLERLGFIRIDGIQVELLSENNNWFNYEKTSDARKTMQKQFLGKAIAAIDEVDFSRRVNSSLTLSVDQTDLSKLKMLIETFIKDADLACQSKTIKKDVYQICVALFPLTKQETV